MAEVFISYAARDIGFALRVREALGQVANPSGKSLVVPWIAKVDLAPGSKWDDALRAQIERSKAVVALVTPAWLASDWCRAEWGAWWFKNRMPPEGYFFALLADGVTPEDVPAPIRVSQSASLSSAADIKRIVVELVPDHDGYTPEAAALAICEASRSPERRVVLKFPVTRKLMSLCESATCFEPVAADASPYKPWSDRWPDLLEERDPPTGAFTGGPCLSCVAAVNQQRRIRLHLQPSIHGHLLDKESQLSTRAKREALYGRIHSGGDNTLQGAPLSTINISTSIVTSDRRVLFVLRPPDTGGNLQSHWSCGVERAWRSAHDDDDLVWNPDEQVRAALLDKTGLDATDLPILYSWIGYNLAGCNLNIVAHCLVPLTADTLVQRMLAIGSKEGALAYDAVAWCELSCLDAILNARFQVSADTTGPIPLFSIEASAFNEPEPVLEIPAEWLNIESGMSVPERHVGFRLIPSRYPEGRGGRFWIGGYLTTQEVWRHRDELVRRLSAF